LVRTCRNGALFSDLRSYEILIFRNINYLTMRILISGFITLVIWSVLSMWLYVDILKPATRKQVVIQPVTPTVSPEADSLAKLRAAMPKELLFHSEFDNINFSENPEADQRVAEFKTWMEKYPATIILVTGYTDFIGTPEYNLKLGQDRADFVAKFLSGKGIPLEKMEISSMGEEKPLGSHITAAGRAMNRRTEVTIKY
jgi:outer membrane protein OmpA-like peptidoglycan-associated protein